MDTRGDLIIEKVKIRYGKIITLLIKAWSDLPEAMKRCILAMIETI